MKNSLISKLVASVRPAARKAVKAIDTHITFNFAPFVVLDSYGTKQYCWSIASANEWLVYCADDAVVVDRVNKKLVCRVVSVGSLGITVKHY